MDLFVKYRGQQCTFTDISLKDFSTPVVNNIELDFQVEPAIWFKSLVIESILIDCNSRNVYWKTKQQPANMGPTRPVFEDTRLEECELYNSAAYIVQSSDKKTNNFAAKSKEILRILHLHILPAIVMKEEDFESLKHALSTVEDRIALLSKTIFENDQELLKTEHTVNERRKLLLSKEQFENKKFSKHCSEKFLNEILDDINHDIRSLTDKLITCQSCVDMACDVITDEGKINLKEWKKKRDEVQSSILNLQTIRESIKHVTNGKKKKKTRKVVFNKEHTEYISLKEKLRFDKLEIRHLFEAKIKATSVREAIILACNDLKISGETTGCEMAFCGERSSTDILGISVKPKKWLTLNERIQGILANSSLEISQIYHAFNSETVKTITDFLDERAMFDKKREANVPFYMPESEYVLPPRKGKAKLEGNSYENVSNDPKSSDSPYKHLTRMLKEDITQHVYNQCQLLVPLLSKEKISDKKMCSDISLNKVTVCYEQILYQHLINPLSKLYEYINKNSATDMSLYVSEKSLHEIGIVEPWLCDFSEDNATASPVCGQAFNSCFEKNVAVVSLRNGGTVQVDQFNEIEDEFHNMIEHEWEKRGINSSFETSSSSEDITLNAQTSDEECHGSQIQNFFKAAGKELENMTRSKTIIGKLKSISKANRMISECASCLKSRHGGHCDDNALNAEDMLASTVCALKYLDSKLFPKVYAHVYLVNDFIPPFMMGSIQDWSLTNFYCAFQCISCNMESNKT